MSAIFEMTLESETLSHDELAEIAGCSRKADQIVWLDKNRWIHYENKAGAAVVGRMYARLKLAGINPSSLAPATVWMPDLSKVR